VWVQGSNNTFEMLDIHHIMGAGCSSSKAATTWCSIAIPITTSTSTRRTAREKAATASAATSVRETQATYFAAAARGGTRTTGYDFINAFDACLVENSWAWYNGYPSDTMTGESATRTLKGGATARTRRVPREPGATHRP